MTEVTIERLGGRIVARTPFNGTFVSGARRLAGKWSGDAWHFPASQEERVRSLCREVYGTDERGADLVTLQVRFPELHQAERRAVFIAGREVVRATGRDSGARLGDGVVLVSGEVGSGGSVKYWTTRIDPGTTLEVLDVPRPAAEAAVAAGRSSHDRVDCCIIESAAC